MTFPDLPVYHRPYNTSVWNLIGYYVLNDLSFSLPETNDLAKFDFKLTNLTNTDLSIDTGDDIVICESIERLKVWGDVAAGTITRIEGDSKGFDDDDKPIFEYNIEFVQKDFSILPLLTLDYSTDINLDTFLDNILLSNTNNELGGSYYSQIIPKYYIECDLVTLASFSYEGTAKECLTEALKSLGLNWSIIYYVKPDNVTTLQLIQQIRITD